MPTRPGINSSFEMAIFPPPEQKIIRRFARYFYITRSINPISIGNSEYSSFFMRPSDDIAPLFNVEREFVVLFASYDTFEARTLIAYNNIYERFDDVRIDTSIRFIVSKDLSIESKIRNYLASDPEYPIIIPFKYDDFSAITDDAIFSRIRRNYLVRDLFGLQSPLKNEYFFFGRDSLVSDVIDLHKAGQNSGLFGLRKSGKTSTIYAIQRKSKSTNVKPVIIDCQDPSVHARHYDSLLAYIVSEVRKSCNLKKITHNIKGDAANVSDNFRDEMIQTLGQARSNILLIFDEIENISPKTAASPHWRHGAETILLWQILRSFFQSGKRVIAHPPGRQSTVWAG